MSQGFVAKSVLDGEFSRAPSALTLCLLRIIGSPFLPNSHQKVLNYSNELYLLACENRIPLAYLDRVAFREGAAASEYNYYLNRAWEKVRIVAKVSNLFERKGIDYAILQAFEPWSAGADDIDILNLGLIFRDPDDIDIHVMGSTEEFREATRILTNAGYKHVATAPYNQCLFDPHKAILLDVKNENSISHLIYVNKHDMDYHLESICLPWGVKTKVLNVETHLLIILADSAIGKNSYRLADYYFTLHSFAQMDGQQAQKFLYLVKKNYLRNAARWYLTVTLHLHMMAHGTMPSKITEALSMLGTPCPEAYRAVKRGESPYPYDLKTLLKVFGEKLKDSSFRRSMLGQIPRSLTPTFGGRFVGRVRWLLGRARTPHRGEV